MHCARNEAPVARLTDVIMDQGTGAPSAAVPDTNADHQNTHKQRASMTSTAATVITPPPISLLNESVSLIHRDDWASDLPDTDHVHFFRQTNWAATKLGALSTWGIALRLHTLSLMADSQAGCIYWYVPSLNCQQLVRHPVQRFCHLLIHSLRLLNCSPTS